MTEQTNSVAHGATPQEWVDLDHIEIANLWSEHKEVYSFGFAVQELFKKKNPRNDLG